MDALRGDTTKELGGIVGWLLFLPASIALFIFEIQWFNEWWGAVGVFAAVFVPPLAAAFPFVYLALEGFSALYFGLLGIVILGTILIGMSDDS